MSARLSLVGGTFIVVMLVLVAYAHPSPDANLTPSEGETLPVKFWDAKAFFDGIATMPPHTKKPFAGMIVPHHLIASTILADMFSRLGEQEPRTIIIVGPNHYEVGDAKVISSRKDWETAFGTITVDRTLLDDLAARGLVAFNDEVMIDEHSTQGMMPYIAFFAPKARIVPLVLSARMTRENVEMLALALQKAVEEGAMIVAAVDFSHHLTGAEAQKRDEITLAALKEQRIDRILSFSSEHLDSPESIALILMLMQVMKRDTFELDYHTNSGELLRDRSIEVTSYIVGTFR